MDGLTEILMYILYFHPRDLFGRPGAECNARNYGPRELLPKSNLDERTERWRDGHKSSTGPHIDPLDPNVGIN